MREPLFQHGIVGEIAVVGGISLEAESVRADASAIVAGEVSAINQVAGENTRGDRRQRRGGDRAVRQP